METYTLMCKNHEVVRFEYRKRTRSAHILDRCDGARWAPIGCCDTDGTINQSNLNGWISMRYIPGRREGLSELLRLAGCSDAPDLMFSSLGLNLSDQYWFKPDGIDVDWHDINYFENPYRDAHINHRAKTGSSQVIFGPSTSTNGQVKKWWESRDGVNYLIKWSTAYGHEPFAELLATKLYAQLLDGEEYVPYTLEYIDDDPYCACPCFITTKTEFASLDDVMRRYDPDFDADLYQAYLHILHMQGLEHAQQQIDDMIVCDYLTGNTDRHEYNLGVILDVETKQMLRVAPLFDSGRAFYYGVHHERDLTGGLFDYTSNPFESNPERQLALVGNLARYDFSLLDCFSDEIREVFGTNDLMPSWFADAAARQFDLRLDHVRKIAKP